MSSVEQPVTRPKARVKILPLSQIKEPKDALRKVNKKREEYLQLVTSVRDKGIINAILVRELKDDAETPYSIVEGLHRYSAAQDAGLTEIPAQIQTMSDAEVYEAQIIGNMKHIETRPAEYAVAMAKIFMSNPTMTKKELASKLSCSTTKIDNILKINDLPEKVRAMIDEGVIKVSNAAKLASLVGVADDEIEENLTAAASLPPIDFGLRIDNRVRTIKSERKAGRVAQKVTEYVPVARLQNISVINSERDRPRVVADVLKELNAKTPEEGFLAALKWVTRLDPISIREDTARFEADKKAEEDAKLARKKERDEKRVREAAAVVAQ